MTDISRPRPQFLGPRQIKWLRERIPAFDEAWTSVKKADEHAAKVREKLESAA